MWSYVSIAHNYFDVMVCDSCGVMSYGALNQTLCCDVLLIWSKCIRVGQVSCGYGYNMFLYMNTSSICLSYSFLIWFWSDALNRIWSYRMWYIRWLHLGYIRPPYGLHTAKSPIILSYSLQYGSIRIRLTYMRSHCSIWADLIGHSYPWVIAVKLIISMLSDQIRVPMRTC